MRFLSRNIELYTFNSTINNYSTRYRIQLHKPSNALTIYQKVPYYEVVSVYNKLAYNIAERISQNKGFLTNLRKYLLAKAFYSVEEYMNDHSDSKMGFNFKVI